MSHLHAVPAARTLTRAEAIDALTRHMLDNPDAIRAVASEIIHGTETLEAAAAEIVRLRGLLGERA